jgi:hypothetical protein
MERFRNPISFGGPQFAQAFRIRKMISERAVRLPSVDQDAWVNRLKANESNVQDVLNTFRAVLHSNATLLARIDEGDWEITAGKIYTLTGPEVLIPVEQVQTIGDVLGKHNGSIARRTVED